MGKVKYQNKTIAYTINKAKIKNIYITIENGSYKSTMVYDS